MNEDKEKAESLPPFDDLEARLKKARKQTQDLANPIEPDGQSKRGMMRGLALALRLATELVAAFAVGVGLGYLLDLWLGTGPFGLIVGFFLGAAAGALNVYRAALGLGLAPGYPPSRGSEDDGAARPDD